MATVIMGLGNPGGEYAKTRHNARRMVVETIAKTEGFDDFNLRKAANASGPYKVEPCKSTFGTQVFM